MKSVKYTQGFIVSLIVPIFVAALYYLFRLDANNARIFEAVLLLAGMYLGVTLFLLDATELHKHYAKINRMPGLGSENTITHSVQPSAEIIQETPSFEGISPAPGVNSVADSSHVPHLITRSLLFMLSLIPLGVFLITSTGSVLGIGLYLGLLTSISSELTSLYQTPQLIRERYLYQLKRLPQSNELMWYVVGVVTWTVLFGVLVVW
ncbi:MAG: hypothetical protein WAU07_05175 [Microgenomates group bacterium]